MLSFCKWISPFSNFCQSPQTSHQPRHVKNICFFWLCNKHSAFHFLSLTTVSFPRRPYVHKWSTRIFNMYWMFCNICKVGLYYAFSTQAVYISNTLKWCPLLKLDITYRSPSAVSRKIFFLPGILGFLQRSNLPPQLTKLLMLLSSQILQLN